ncbi:class I SAM-dependent methyltransferase [Corynebacterium sanguinis]|uniref:O-methyltransferase n=1 Tax=Corynebacterium sanguinis TaxID=2594913 RepID=UPI00223BE768|nr:class I SAM-dependent methyltransferase [Corynebacterium sanguinis]MCT1425906.1 class I SAM-dependent methyltransferase [Corynebacterium sanguinis]MCT1627790.1 class I SAM-dependent methyltransferase [Corynebacterium sanguinis]
MTDTAFTTMNTYIASRPVAGAADAAEQFAQGFDAARTEAEENNLVLPSPAVGSLLSTLAAATTSAHGAVAVTPAAGVVGLYILRGLPQKATVTCIDPEATHQASAKEAFRLGGFAASRGRFLTARPLDVMSRLAPASYQLVYADVEPTELSTVIKSAWPLLAPGGTLVLAGSLLDGTLTDATRRDRATEAARAAEDDVDGLAASEGAVVTRLPLDGGLTLVTKR